MCGIVGVWFRRQDRDATWFENAIEILRSRGPDGQGSERLCGGRVILGHTRLAIIDVGQSGRQPLANEDQTVWISFNGEIYNYRQLRSELQSLGHQFQTRTDTEVIVHAYEQWGEACVHRLDGIFAFGIWDETRQSMFLARDPIGIKPLYYTCNQETFCFASQPKAILQDPSFSVEVDSDAFRDFLAFSYVPDPQSIFAGIQRLPPAHTLTVTHEGSRLERYWQCQFVPSVRSFSEAASEISARLTSAVESQMTADVPVGTLLSGGIDSALLTALAHQYRNADFGALHSFTLGFDQDGFDERQYAQIAATHVGTNHCVDLLEEAQLAVQLEDAVEAFDEPFDLNGPIPMTRLARFVRDQGVKVVLGGDGGDELYAGYLRYDFFNRYCASPRRWLSFQRSARSRAHAYFQHEGVCTPEVLEAIMPAHFDRSWLERSIERTQPYFESKLPPVVACQLLDFHHYLPGHILTKVDRATMRHGVEARVPFLGRENVELAFRIPSQFNYRKGERKAALKQVARTHLPTELLTARKKGFSSPMKKWTSALFVDWAKHKLKSGLLVSMELIRPTALDACDFEGPGKPFRAFWLLLAAELWAERWLVNDPNRQSVQEQLQHYRLSVNA